jgi:DNA anti-recombination protein RmuC
MNHLGDTNKMVSETPRTDEAIWNRLDRSWMDGTLCRQLERELNAEKQHVTELENRLRALWDNLEYERKHYMEQIRRLEEAGNAMCKEFAAFCPLGSKTRDKWRKAKESKP